MRSSSWHSLARQSTIILSFCALFWILASLSAHTTKPPWPILVLVGTFLLVLLIICAAWGFRAWDRSEGIRSYILSNQQIWVVMAYGVLSARDLAVIPTCDNGAYFKAVLDAVSRFNFVSGESLSAMKLFDHPTFGYSAYMMMGQFIDYGNFLIANVQSRLLAVLAILAFGGIMGLLFPGSRRWPERLLGTALFAFTPLVYGLSLTVSPDFAVLVFLCVTIYCYLKGLHLLTLASGIMLSLSKEAGALLYATLVIGIFAIQLPLAAIRRDLDRARLYLQSAARSMYLMIPILLFGSYLVIDRQQWTYVGQAFTMSSIYFKNITYDKTVQVFLANFNWLVWGLITISLLSGLGKHIRIPHRGEVIDRRDSWFVVLAGMMIPFLLVNYMFQTWNNARYIVPFSMVAVLLLVRGLETLTRSALARNGLLSICLGLLVVGCFRTVDPILLHLFPTFTFGEHRMSFYNSQRTVCDLTLYNREYVYYNRLFDEFLKESGLNAHLDSMVFFAQEGSAPLVSWNTTYLWTGNPWTGELYVDSAQGRRTYQQDGRPVLKSVVFVRGVSDPLELPVHAFSIQLFWTARVGTEAERVMLDNYDVVRKIRVEQDGYYLDGFELALKEGHSSGVGVAPD